MRGLKNSVKNSISLVCIVAATAAAIARIQDPPQPTPISFTPVPRQLQWRIGFDLGNAVILETPELNPENDVRLAAREAERLFPNPPLDFGLVLLPVSKITMRSDRLVNPRQWTILDLSGKTSRRSFQTLAVFMGTRMTSIEGGYHLVSVPAMPDNSFLTVRREPSAEGLLIGFAGTTRGRMQIHTKLSETKWENLLPVEDPALLPAGYPAAKQLLDDHSPDASQRFLYGTAIEALVGNRINKFWLLNYSHPDTTVGNHPWGIFVENGTSLEPLYVYNPADSDAPYVAYFTASIDLNQDGNDELIVEASYRFGSAYKVISKVGGTYQEILSSYYRGLP